MENSDPVSSWEEARSVIAAWNRPKTDKEIRTWATRVKAITSLKKISKEERDSMKAFPAVRAGEFGICRFRVLQLSSNPEMDDTAGGEFVFGDLYSVHEIDSTGAWISVESITGSRGWLHRANHFGITRGEFKVLRSSKKSSALNFLVTAIHLVA